VKNATSCSSAGQHPLFLHHLLNNPPRAGEGVHFWLYRAARQLHVHLPAVKIINLLLSKAEGCGRTVTRQEVEDAVRNSLDRAWQPRSGQAVQPVSKWPRVNQEQRETVIKDGGGLVDLWELSPWKMDDNQAHTEEIIDRLFPGNPLLCCGESNRDFNTRLRENWRGELAQLALIVPSPMSAVTGTTKDGHESKHTLDNTGARRFLIVEFDTGTTDEHAALMIHLASKGPLVCVVHSGNKSLHGWFYAHGQPEAKVLNLFRYAVSLGADHATWTRSQFVRIPDGTRDNGQRQTVFFLNLKPLAAQ
jgi:hypothetical protein